MGTTRITVDRLPWGERLEGLPLRSVTSASWPRAALADLDALLVDHAHCEQKAASTALALVGRFADEAHLVRPMLALAREEMLHFRQVLDLIEARGRALARPPRDRYVGALRERCFRHPGGLGPLGDRLLVCALIEARSCERFRCLAEALLAGEGDLPTAERDGLVAFYARLAGAEGRHWELFRDLASRTIRGDRVERRLASFAGVEAEIIAAHPDEPRIH